MGRISFVEKLQARDDYKIILSTLRVSPEPTKYLMGTFNITYPTALKTFNSLCPVLDKVSKKASTSDDELATKVLFSIESDLDREATCRILMNISDNLKKFSTHVLQQIFTKLSGKTCTTDEKFRIILAIKYLIQDKYYTQIFKKEINDKTKFKTQLLVKDCI